MAVNLHVPLANMQDPLTPALSLPYPLADMASLSGKLAKASLLGEGVSGVDRVRESWTRLMRTTCLTIS
jgi:hypothetical protein